MKEIKKNLDRNAAKLLEGVIILTVIITWTNLLRRFRRDGSCHTAFGNLAELFDTPVWRPVALPVTSPCVDDPLPSPMELKGSLSLLRIQSGIISEAIANVARQYSAANSLEHACLSRQIVIKNAGGNLVHETCTNQDTVMIYDPL